MIDFDNLPTHPMVEALVDDLCPAQETHNRPFYRVMVGYFFAKMASCMRATIDAPGVGTDIPVNCFAVALAPSGFGKNTAVGRIERGTMTGFKKRFMTETMPVVADASLYELAIDKAMISGKTEEDEKERLFKLYNAQGPYLFTSKKATSAAVEQARTKGLMSKIGAINMQIDEIGLNITDKFVMEGLTVFLELYDMGHMDSSMTKNSNDNQRVDDLDGSTPANLLAFGTPSKLFDGAQAQQAFEQLLDTGYARRCFFAWGTRRPQDVEETVEEAYDRMVAKQRQTRKTAAITHFTELADSYKHGWELTVPRETGLKHMAYKIQCKERMKEIPSHQDIRRTEMEHRHWKALKLAGALAFVDESMEITPEHFLAAVGITEDSGKALEHVLSPEKPFVKLAKYIADATEPVTHADLYEALPFYKSSGTARNEMMTLAQAWGYKNHVIIRKSFEDGIEFFEGDTLDETDVDNMIFSYSNHEAFNYTHEGEPVPFAALEQLVTQDGLHWCNHMFMEGHRHNDKTIPGFNMIVVDVDGEARLDFVHEALKDYTFMTYTTKRHTPEAHRFRLMMPISHILELNQEDYRDFMDSMFLWLPFESDKAANQRSKKWLTCDAAQVTVNEGELLSPLPFIPKTSKNAEYREQIKALGNLDNLERWFAQRMATGDRNNQMIKYALALLDGGMGIYEIEQRVLGFNASLSNGLDPDEISNTIMKTVARKFTEAA